MTEFPVRRAALSPILSRGAALVRGLIDLVLPPGCTLCRRPVAGPSAESLCGACLADLPLLDVVPCPGCGGAPVEGPLDFCPHCRERFFRDGLVAPLSFTGGARELVHAFKYRGDLAAGRCLGRLLAAEVLGKAAGRCDTVVPVPLHFRRLRRRGYNQAALLARSVSEATGWTLVPRALARLRDTRSLAGLERRERLREVGGSLAVRSRRRIAGRRILLVDDVVTTGSTVEECARALKKAGAVAVVAAAAGRALPAKNPLH